MKKLLLSLGAVAAVVAPVATVVACGDSSDSGTTEDAKVSKDITVHKKDGKIVSVDIANFGANTMKEFQDKNSPIQTAEGLLDFVKDEDANGGNVHFHLTADFKTTLKATKDVITLTEYNVLVKAAFPGMNGGDEHNSGTPDNTDATTSTQVAELTSTYYAEELKGHEDETAQLQNQAGTLDDSIQEINSELGIDLTNLPELKVNGADIYSAIYFEGKLTLVISLNGDDSTKSTHVYTVKATEPEEVTTTKTATVLSGLTVPTNVADLAALDTLFGTTEFAGKTAELNGFDSSATIVFDASNSLLKITIGHDTLEYKLVQDATVQPA